MRALVIEYKRSPNYRDLAPHSRALYDRALELIKGLEAVKASDITRGMILKIRDAVALSAPAASNTFAGVMSLLFQFGLDRDYVQFNPCHRLKRVKIGTYKAWPDDAVTYVLKKFPEPLRRAALVALYTGQREIDCVAMTWEKYDGTGIQVRQQKTGEELWIPAHRVLKRELDAWNRDQPTILTHSRGLPWSVGGFAVSFHYEMAKHANLRGLVFHGLRKCAAARLAEAGCSAHEIMSITGHRSIAMVDHYTRSASQKLRAQAAMAKLQLVADKPVSK